MAQSGEIKKLLLSWKKLKKNIYNSLKDNKFVDIQKSLSSFVKDSQSQFNKKVDKDVDSLKKRFNKEKKTYWKSPWFHIKKRNQEDHKIYRRSKEGAW